MEQCFSSSVKLLYIGNSWNCYWRGETKYNIPDITVDIINSRQIDFRIIKWRYISAPRSWSHKDYSCFDFPGHLMFTFDEFGDSLRTSIFGNSSSAANITRSILPSRLPSVSYGYNFTVSIQNGVEFTLIFHQCHKQYLYVNV